jgi:hypothetical protein
MDEDQQRARETHRAVLTALARVAAEPVRLAEAVSGAVDDADAVTRLAAAFDLDPRMAAVVLDQQVRLLTRAYRERVARDLEDLGSA